MLKTYLNFSHIKKTFWANSNMLLEVSMNFVREMKNLIEKLIVKDQNINQVKPICSLDRSILYGGDQKQIILLLRNVNIECHPNLPQN